MRMQASLSYDLCSTLVSFAWSISIDRYSDRYGNQCVLTQFSMMSSTVPYRELGLT